MSNYKRIASLKTADDFASYIETAGVKLQFDRELQHGTDSPLGRPYQLDGFKIGNRFCILPMEGWDGTEDGKPSELTIRRWRRFGESGAKLIWGGEAVAVRHDGRANPNQLMSSDDTTADLENLRKVLIAAHEERRLSSDDLLVGLQLTHSGRFARPNDKKRLEPRILYHHPILDRKFNISPDHACLTDSEIDDLIGDFVKAAARARTAGFAFVDLKHCHGYLGHEFLSATTREGRYGGSFENRTRFLRELVAGVRRDAPGLMIGVRLSAFDFLPFKMGDDRRGVPEHHDGLYPHAFGGDAEDPLKVNLKETFQFFDLLDELKIKLVCVSAGSPYYNPHIQRPALFLPSDAYDPPEDPLAGVARLIEGAGELKSRYPQMCVVGSGYTYLQDWLPNVGQYYVHAGRVDFVGLGRMVLAYHDLPFDLINGSRLQTKRLCRTFSDCTTGPRNGLISGCYPLDPFYKEHPQAEQLKTLKRQLK
ncbi:MAG TPA: NADH:flavin oxidoreductase [Blastocatellia bacterium]|jgi:2,4-dienoyl-CoA reductase-like NADH-dependent reductase (Old Yellow Enzyme family)|nr:NADH:flavin oxidoreductase [Blastocatellia bacterium]